MRGKKFFGPGNRTWLPALCLAAVLCLPGISFCLGRAETSWAEGTSRTEDAEIRKVALSYDDGPDPVYTKQLLEVLEEADVKASFFLLGKEVEGQEELVKEMYAAGHVIGNHTYSHVDLSGLSTTDAMAELADANEAIRNCTGEYPQFFRPPFGRISETLNSRLPMMMVLWNVDPKDWNCQDTGEIVNHIVKNVQENDIILLHDGYGTTVEATRQIIPILREQGYTFVTVEELMLP